MWAEARTGGMADINYFPAGEVASVNTNGPDRTTDAARLVLGLPCRADTGINVVPW